MCNNAHRGIPLRHGQAIVDGREEHARDDMTLFNLRAVNKGALKATVSIRLGSGLAIHDCKMIQQDGVLSAALPQRSVIPDPRAIHFMKVAQNRTGKRRIAGVTSFVSPRVTQPSSSIQAAVFTD